MHPRSLMFLGLAALLAFTSCSHRVVRTGYSIDKGERTRCDITITKDASLAENASAIGTVKLGESGFSTSCSEAKAMETLQLEGCALNADLVLITSETYPDVWSSCYRCEATFYSLPEGEEPEINSRASVELTEASTGDEVIQDNKPPNNNIGAQILGYVLGFALGYGLVAIIMN